jgi:4-hydroxy-tetrahydrodipicolinate synthase
MRALSSHSPAWLSGFIADLPTPFDEHGDLDLGALTRLCERQVAAGASALVVAETAAEAATLTPAEHAALVRAAVSAARGRIKVVAGAGSNSTSQAIELAQQARVSGADAVMSVVPYYNKPTPAGIEAHFASIARSTSLPVILHDNPGRCVRALSDEALIRLARLPCIAGLRDATGDLLRPGRLKRALPPGFRLLGGDDATALAFLMQGGDGCVSNTANVFPELNRELYDAIVHEQSCYAATIQDRLAPLVDMLSEDTTPATLKYALSRCGLMRPTGRLPVVEIDDPAKRNVEVSLDRVRAPLRSKVPA